MKSAKLFCFFVMVLGFCFFAHRAFGTDSATTFSGIVVDKAEGVPIPYAHVWIHEQSGKAGFTAQPDQAGQFTIELPEGYYDVLVGAPGFAPFCKKIWVKPGSAIKLKVSLGPDDENSQVD